MIIVYPTVLFIDEKNPNWYNVLIVNIRGGSTCGYDFDNAISMAKERLNLIKDKYSNQLLKPDSIEDIQALYPKDKVMMLEAEVSDDFSFPTNSPLPPRNEFKSYYISMNKIDYEIIGSTVDHRLSRVFVVDKEYRRIEEEKDADKKYKILQIARAEQFEKIWRK